MLKLAAATPPVPASSRGQANLTVMAKKEKMAKKRENKTAVKAVKVTPMKAVKVTPMKVKSAKQADTELITPVKGKQMLKADRKNVHSRAYHKALHQARAQGCSDDESKKAAREAAKKAVESFDAEG